MTNSPTASAPAAVPSTAVQDFLTFKLMVTPVIIQIIFWIGVGLCLLSGLGAIIMGFAGGGVMLVIGGLVYMVVGPILVRIYCELLILFFRMNQTLTDIRNLTASHR